MCTRRRDPTGNTQGRNGACARRAHKFWWGHGARKSQAHSGESGDQQGGQGLQQHGESQAARKDATSGGHQDGLSERHLRGDLKVPNNDPSGGNGRYGDPRRQQSLKRAAGLVREVVRRGGQLHSGRCPLAEAAGQDLACLTAGKQPWGHFSPYRAMAWATNHTTPHPRVPEPSQAPRMREHGSPGLCGQQHPRQPGGPTGAPTRPGRRRHICPCATPGTGLAGGPAGWGRVPCPEAQALRRAARGPRAPPSPRKGRGAAP